jgi:hypothetical protein
LRAGKNRIEFPGGEGVALFTGTRNTQTMWLAKDVTIVLIVLELRTRFRLRKNLGANNSEWLCHDRWPQHTAAAQDEN